MNKNLFQTFVLVLLLAGTTAVEAQERKATAAGSVLDATTEAGIPGAVVEIVPAKTPDKKRYVQSAANGSVTIPSLAYGDYELRVSFMGYQADTLQIKVASARHDLGQIRLKPAMIETVVKEVHQIRTSQDGDTISYNAGAFKVANDADVEGLLKKMPGMKVSDGTVEVQGETVKKILVDGKEFFGEDVTTAIKSLPAEAVDRIEVFNKLSDQAEFSGMDDGEGYKALNIVTRPNMRQGQFGKIYAGYGYDPDAISEPKSKYLAGGNVNLFHGSTRLSVIGLFNNVNQQNFSFEDILGVTGSGGGGRGVGQYMMRPQSGVAHVNALGLNFSKQWGADDKVKLSGSYFFNNTNTNNRSSLEKWYEAPSPIDTLEQTGYSSTLNNNHRLNLRLDWKISENQSLMSRSNFSTQSNDPQSGTDGWHWGQSGYSTIFNRSNSSSSGYNLRQFLQYRAKLGKDGRTISVDGSVNYRDNKNNKISESNRAGAIEYDYLNIPFKDIPFLTIDDLRDQGSILKQYIVTPSTSYSLRGGLTYTEPLSKYSQLSVEYSTQYNYSERDRRSYDDQEVLNPQLSNSYNSSYITHRVGPGFRWSKQKNTFVAKLFYQASSLEGEFIYPNAEKIKHNYGNLTYFMMGNLQFNKQNSMRLFVMSRTEEPNLGNLQSVPDVSNPQYISAGNPALDPSYSHTVNFHYNHTNIEKGRTFMWMFSLNTTQDYIGNNVLYDKTLIAEALKAQNLTGYTPLQYTSPVNMNGYFSVRTHISYGLPVKFLKSNLNLSAGVNYSTTPSMIDNRKNTSEYIGYDAHVVLGSNISEKIDFTLSWNGTYSTAENSQVKKQTNNYLYHSATGSLKLVFWKGFTLTASASYTQNIGFTNDYNEEYVLCNLYLGKKVFKNQRGEILVGVNDLLNQNTAFSRSVGSGYTQNSVNSVIGRYYMVQFVYNLRHFGKRGSKNAADYDNGSTQQFRGSGRQRPMGPPPGGGRPF